MKSTNILYALFCLFLPISSWAQQPAETTQNNATTKIIGETAVYFDFGKYDLRPDADSSLSQFFTEIKDKKNVRIEVTAHTDSIGTIEANTLLSQNRADQVKRFLVAQGIPDSVVTASVYGESTPVADNNSDEGRQKNRRATVRVLRDMPMGKYVGKVTDEATGKGIQAEIILHSKMMRDSFFTDKNGAFETNIPLGQIIGFDVYAPCYFFENKMFRVERVGQLEFALKKMDKGASFPIKNLYFVGNEDKLLPKSAPTLPKLLQFMQKNDCGKIEIAGHINRPNNPPVVETSWDFQLSVRRAKVVYAYLINNGISADRLSFKGYGNSQMVYPTARSEEQQSLNRRVELRVLDDRKPEVEAKIEVPD